MKCPTCGNDNTSGAQFCGGCGASLSASKPIGVGAASSEPPTGSFPKTIKTTHHRRIKPWMWIVFVGGLLWFAFGYFYTLECCKDWGQVSRGDSFAEEGQYDMAIEEYDEAIRLERYHAEAYYKRGLAYEAIGKTIEAERDFEKAIQVYDEAIPLVLKGGTMVVVGNNPFYGRGLAYEALGKTIEAERDFEKTIQWYDETILRLDSNLSQSDHQILPTEWGRSSAFYGRGLAYEALDKPEEAARDFQKALAGGLNEEEQRHIREWLKELGYDDDGPQSTGLLEAAPEASNFQNFQDDFTKTIEVAPLVLESELSTDDAVTSWSFEGNEGQILQFELRPESGSHVDFGHVQIRLSLVDDERLQTADPEVIGKDEELEEIALPETGTYTLEVEGNIDETSGAYVITISGQ